MVASTDDLSEFDHEGASVTCGRVEPLFPFREEYIRAINSPRATLRKNTPS